MRHSFFWHVPIIGFSWNLHKTSGWKVKGHTDCSKFLSCLLHGSVPIWLIPFIFCTNITHEMMMCHTPFPGQKAEDQDHTGCSKLRSRVVLSFCHVCSVACCLFDRFVLYVVQIQPMKSWCVTHHFHFKGSKVQVTQARWKFWPYPLCLPANFTDWYVAQKQVIRTISRSKGRWSKSYGLLEVFVMSVPWLFDRFTSYEAQIKPMEGRCITHHFQVTLI